ncbi:acireductone dioxygenase [Lysobacter pythonis]|uniref:Acireductone dioxygenase n=1 Tax=Solilutibacter pythonis TaxID=2483112 RepID=A0A3M2HV14_9GAMM|nr:acireductone dioxygenase [Lysobacter pythonis]RMH90762.1 acireductone dioxygenase [Lysobacter pythonis]
MSRLRVYDDNDPGSVLLETHAHMEIARELDHIGVVFERWLAVKPVKAGDTPEAIMAAYRDDIDRLVEANGFNSVDVVSIAPDHPQREAMRAKFLEEHTHKEGEVRFFVDGSGLFSLHADGKVYEVLCEKGDLIHVPDGAAHWFDMGAAPAFVAIRFFTNPDGWVGDFTGSDIARRFPRYEK